MSFNWRKPVIMTGLYLSGSKIPGILKEIEQVSRLPQDEIQKYQEMKLEKLLLHAYEHVPYYHRVLAESGVIHDGNVKPENFQKIPILTKKDIQKNFEDLKSDDLKNRRHYVNHTGGSTGQPLEFIQDKDYSDWNIANKIYYCKLAGKIIGEKEMKIWGSERDIIESSTSLKQKTIQYLYNRTFENTFLLSNIKMNDIIFQINTQKPTLIWGYLNSLYALSKYINSHNFPIHKPHAIISAAGTLTGDIREEIELAFQAPVHNVYGSREMGDIAFEERVGKGLKIFQHSHIVEINYNNESNFGKIIVTPLNNYSMPFFRYDIGDVTEGFYNDISGSTNFISLKNVLGRETSMFKTKSGDLIPSEFFIHIIGVVFNSGFIDKFQVIQKKFDLVVIKIVLQKECNREKIGGISSAIKKVMGDVCEVKYEFVDEIAPTKNGKYMYTICEVSS